MNLIKNTTELRLKRHDDMTFRQFLKESKEYLPESKTLYFIGLPFVFLRFYIYKFTGGKF